MPRNLQTTLRIVISLPRRKHAENRIAQTKPDTLYTLLLSKKEYRSGASLLTVPNINVTHPLPANPIEPK